METVIECKKVRDWVKDGKSVPIYAIGISDGQGGESFGKEIPIGTPLSELTIEDNGQYAKKIKWTKQVSSGGYSKQRGGNESFALAYAKDLVVSGKVDLSQILSTADKLYTWLEGKKINAPTIPTVKPVQKPAPQAPLPTDDLPF